MTETEARIRGFLRVWVGEAWQSETDSPGWRHAASCAAYGEGQACCLDEDHARFDALVVGLLDAIGVPR